MAPTYELMKTRLSFLFTLALALILPAAAVQAGTYYQYATDSGWYDDTGYHDPTNSNYLVGRSFSGGIFGRYYEYRDFQVFSLPTFAPGETLVSARVVLSSGSGGYISSDPTETLQFYDVSTAVSTLTAGGSGLTSIFTDLGSGTAFSDGLTVSAATNTYPNNINVFPLNAAFVNYAASNAGSTIAIGGRLTTLATGYQQVMFSFSGSAGNYLILETTGPFPPVIGGQSAATNGLTTAALSATVNPSSNPTTAYFRYGTAANLSGATSTSSQSIGSGASAVAVQQGLSGLTPNVTYYYQTVASNGGGTTNGAIQSFVQNSPLDPSFDTDGVQTTAFPAAANGRAVVVQADGKTVVAGEVASGAYTDSVLARYLVDGTLDPAFGTGGTVTTVLSATNDQIRGLALQSDGKILAAGYAGSPTADFAVARYNADGSLDATFGTGGKVLTDFVGDDGARAVVVQSDGKIVVVGTSNGAGGSYDFALARYNSNGSLDTSFDGDGKVIMPIGSFFDEGWSVKLQSDGKIVMGGIAYNGTNYDFALARFNANGSLDLSFNGTGKVTVGIGTGDDFSKSIAILPDGKIVLAGQSNIGGNYDFAVARFNANGSLDTTFDGDGKATTVIGSSDDTGENMVVQSDGKIVVVGGSYNGSNYDFAVVRYNTNGSLDTTFDGDGKLTLAGGTGTDYLYAVAIDAEGRIVCAGTSNNASGVAQFAVVRVLGFPAPGVWNVNEVQLQAGAGGISVTGQMDAAGLSTTATLEYGTTAAFGSSTALGTFTGNGLQAVSATLYPGGLTRGTTYYFRIVATNANGTTTGATQSLTFAPGALDYTFGQRGTVTTPIGAANEQANAVVVQSDGKVLAAGFSNNGSNDDFALVRYNADGTLDTSFGGSGRVTTAFASGNDGINAVALQPDGKILVAGQTHNGSNYDFALARYLANGTLDTSFGSGGKVATAFGTSDDAAYGVAIQADGKIVVVGAAIIGSTYDFAVARYLPNGALDMSFDGDGKLTTQIATSGDGYDYAQGVVIQPDGKILVAGHSTNGTNLDFSAVRYNPDGSLDTSLDGDGKVLVPIGGADVGTAVALQSDGKILVAGQAVVGAFNDFALVRLNANGGLDSTFGSGGKVNSPFGSGDDFGRSVVVQADGKIVMAGFAVIGGTYNMAVVRYLPDGSLDPTFATSGKTTIRIGAGNDVGVALALQADGNLVLAGYSNNGNNDIAVVRLLGMPLPNPANIVVNPAAAGAGLTVSGQVDPGGLSTSISIEYGTTAALGSSVSGGTFTGTGAQSFSGNVFTGGIAKGATIYYRVSATNANGTTTGSILSFINPVTYELVTGFQTGPSVPDRGNLLLHTDGNFYGTSRTGGTFGNGTIFKVTPAGVVTTLVNFSGTTGTAEGRSPLAGMVSDGAGVFWGATRFGGANDLGTVYKYAPATGTLTTVGEFTGGVGAQRGAQPNRELVSDGAGSWWGTTYQGGFNGMSTVYKINNATGAFTTVIDFAGTTTAPRGRGCEQALTYDGAGTMWGTTSFGGAGDFGTIFKINTTTGVLTTVQEFTGTTGAVLGNDPDGNLVSDGAGFFWGSTYSGGTSGNGTIFKVNASTGAFSTLINFQNTTAPKGANPIATFYRDDTSNVMWGTTRNGGANSLGTIFKINRSTNALTTVQEFTGTSGAVKGSEPFAGLISDGASFLWGTTTVGGAANLGTVFKINATTNALTTVSELTTTDNKGGLNPIFVGTIRDAAGNLYGTAANGGAFGHGTVFKITPAGVVTSLVDFTGTTGSALGRQPHADLLLASDGNFYGTTKFGGVSDFGTVFKLTPAGVFTTLAVFNGTTGNKGAQPLPELVEGADGQLYGTTSLGGNANIGTIFKIAKTGGTLTTLINFAGNTTAPVGNGPAGKLLLANDGNFYGITGSGGASGFGTIFKMTPGSVLTTLVQFTGTSGANPGRAPEARLMQAADGLIYGTTIYGGANDWGTIFKLTLAGVRTTLYDFSSANGYGTMGVNNLAQLPDGALYSTAYSSGANNAGTLFRITTGGVFTPLGSFTGTGTGYLAGNNPRYVSYQADGNLYGSTTGGGPGGGTIYRIRFGPTPSTQPATNLTTRTATLNATVNPNGTASTVRYEWGTSAGALTNSTTAQALAASTVAVTQPVALTGLQPATTYFFRVRAENADQFQPQFGEVLSFTTLADTTPPTLSTVSIASINANPVWAKLGDTVMLSFTANEAIQTPSVTLLGAAATAVNVGGNNWTATVTVGTGTVEGAATFSIVAGDLAGNLAAAVPATTDNSLVTVDKTAPVVTPPANLVAHATSPAGAVASYPAATAPPDASGAATLTYSQNSGTLFANGPTTVTVTARDAANNVGTATFTVTVTPLTSLDLWRYTYFGTATENGNTADSADYDGDGTSNLLEWAFGLDPTVASNGALIVSGATIVQRGTPTVWLQNLNYGVDYRALFGRRKDYLAVGLTYTVQFSADLLIWETSTDAPTVIASDVLIDAVTVPYPFFLTTGQKAQFFRVTVTVP